MQRIFPNSQRLGTLTLGKSRIPISLLFMLIPTKWLFIDSLRNPLRWNNQCVVIQGASAEGFLLNGSERVNRIDWALSGNPCLRLRRHHESEDVRWTLESRPHLWLRLPSSPGAEQNHGRGHTPHFRPVPFPSHRSPQEQQPLYCRDLYCTYWTAHVHQVRRRWAVIHLMQCC